MAQVTIRELRNQGADVLARVAKGDVLTVTRDGDPVAELRPLPRRPVPADVLMRRWRRVPVIDAVTLRQDVDAALDAAAACLWSRGRVVASGRTEDHGPRL